MGERYTFERTPSGYVVYDTEAKIPLRVKVGWFDRKSTARTYAAFLNTGATAANAALGRQVREAAAALGVDAARVGASWPEMLAFIGGIAGNPWEMIGEPDEPELMDSDAMLDHLQGVAVNILARLSPAPAEGEGVEG